MDPGVQGRESFIPGFTYVTGISNDLNAIATLANDHDYSVGELLSFRVSRPFGMFEINNKTGKVLSLTSNTVTVDIDTLRFSAFVYPVSGKNTPPTVVPAGSGVIPYSNPPTVNLLDVFDCVRPS